MRQDQRDALAVKAGRGQQLGVLETVRPGRASGRDLGRAIKREARARGPGPAELLRCTWRRCDIRSLLHRARLQWTRTPLRTTGAGTASGCHGGTAK